MINTDNSRASQVLEAVTEKSQAFGQHSTIINVGQRLASRTAAVVRSSYCYRWLTKEPEPEVIVIDLRETRTVGPILVILERAIDPLERAWMNSQAEAIATSTAEQVTELPGYDLAVKLLEPPEPPENEK